MVLEFWPNTKSEMQVFETVTAVNMKNLQY